MPNSFSSGQNSFIERPHRETTDDISVPISMHPKAIDSNFLTSRHLALSCGTEQPRHELMPCATGSLLTENWLPTAALVAAAVACCWPPKAGCPGTRAGGFPA